MAWLKTAAGELLALFADDGAYALAILLWVAASWLLLRLGLPPPLPPVLLFVGLAAILVESAARRARRGRSQ